MYTFRYNKRQSVYVDDGYSAGVRKKRVRIYYMERTEMTDKSCKEFIEVLSSRSPVPGGGGAAGEAGALPGAGGYGGFAKGSSLGFQDHARCAYD